MIRSRSTGLKMWGVLFLALLFIIGIGFSLGALLAIPLIHWAIHGVLHFPVAPSELLDLLAAILGVTVVATVVTWLAGRFKRQW